MTLVSGVLSDLGAQLAKCLFGRADGRKTAGARAWLLAGVWGAYALGAVMSGLAEGRWLLRALALLLAGRAVQIAAALSRPPAAGLKDERGKRMATTTTWQPHDEHGKPSTSDKDHLPETAFAFPKQRKEPLTDASHVRNALARFDQVRDVTDADRDLAFANIKKAAEHHGVEVAETSWHELGKAH